MIGTLRNLAALCFAVILLTIPLIAQTDRASVNGTVTDASGSAVQNARIEAVSVDTGIRRQAATGSAGTYEFAGLPIGLYKVTIEKEGFRTMAIDHVVLSVGEARTLDARLEVGGITEMVEVAATPEPVNRSSADVGAVIDGAEIKELPLNGRSFAT